MNFELSVKNFIQDKGLLRKGDLILVGISGGADSVALTLLLRKIQYEFGVRIMLAHFNHNLSKACSVDEKFVRSFAASLNIPVVVGKWTKTKGIKVKASLEERAREARFEFFKKIYQEQKADALALAHHKDDLAETVLMRIIRGSGSYGLRSILPKREIYGCNVIRPFLAVSRKDIEVFLKTQKAEYRTDFTNFDTDFFRNKIRLELLPLLQKSYNPEVSSALGSLADILTVDNDFIQIEAKKIFERIADIKGNSLCFDIRKLLNQHPALQRMIIRLSYEKLKGDTRSLEYRHFEEVEQLCKVRPDNSVVELPFHILVKKINKFLIFKK
ncbi:MAG: tRNA lysidine(34) synthetase TilS [Candidatus Omnitrophica bacterium]|nr:tRNA lysidine(34) synthetase TilS [Candidatus Omnitrophota bacterium]